MDPVEYIFQAGHGQLLPCTVAGGLHLALSCDTIDEAVRNVSIFSASFNSLVFMKVHASLECGGDTCGRLVVACSLIAAEKGALIHLMKKASLIFDISRN